MVVGIFLCCTLCKGRYFHEKYPATAWGERASVLTSLEPLNIGQFAEGAVRAWCSDPVFL